MAIPGKHNAEVTLVWKQGRTNVEEEFRLYYNGGGMSMIDRTWAFANMHLVSDIDLYYSLAIYLSNHNTIMACDRFWTE